VLIKEISHRVFLDAGAECRAILASNAGMIAGRSPARAQRSVEPQICAADREEIEPIVCPTAATPRINVYRRPISAAVGSYEALCKHVLYSKIKGMVMV
jgi:hypothetical protein